MYLSKLTRVTRWVCRTQQSHKMISCEFDRRIIALSSCEFDMHIDFHVIWWPQTKISTDTSLLTRHARPLTRLSGARPLTTDRAVRPKSFYHHPVRSTDPSSCYHHLDFNVTLGTLREISMFVDTVETKLWNYRRLSALQVEPKDEQRDAKLWNLWF
jgi:hypothetical protein